MSPNRIHGFAPLAKSILLLAVWMTSVATRGAEKHVSISGADSSDGSSNAPWRHIAHAVTQLTPGDTLNIAAGIYEEKLSIKVSGTPAEPILIKAAPGAILTGKGVKGDHMIHVANQSHIHISGLEIRDLLGTKDGSGIRIEGACADIQILSCRIHEIRGKDAMGITVYGTSPEQAISGLVIRGNEVFDCDPATSEAIVLNGNVDGFEVSNNTVHDVNNIGIDFIGGEDWVNKDRSKVTRNGVCKNNTVYRCRSSYGGGYAAGIYVDGGQSIIIENNTVTQCDMGLEVGAENPGTVTSGIIVRKNILYMNDKAGLVFGGYEKGAGRVKDCRFESNVCYHNDQHRKDQNGELWIQWAEDNIITGNTFWAGQESPIINVDKGAGTNELSANQHFSDAGAEDAYYNWRETDVDGFRSWQQTSGQDSSSTFSQPQWKPPATP
jgi:hypothetical protein